MKTFNARNVGTMLKPFVDLLLCSTKKSIGFDSVFGLFTLFFILFYFILFFYFIFFWGGGRGGGGSGCACVRFLCLVESSPSRIRTSEAIAMTTKPWKTMSQNNREIVCVTGNDYDSVTHHNFF